MITKNAAKIWRVTLSASATAAAVWQRSLIIGNRLISRCAKPCSPLIDERSTVTVGALMLMVTLYLCVAAVWNTGSLIDQKIRTQAVADAAALSAANQLSSAANQMVMLNMLQLRLVSGQKIAITGIVVAAAGIAGAVGGIAISVARLIATWGTDASAWTNIAFAIKDIVQLAIWLSKLVSGEIAINKIAEKANYNTLQLAVKKNVGGYIYEQTKVIEAAVSEGKEDFGDEFNIYVSHPSLNPLSLKPSKLYTPNMSKPTDDEIPLFFATSYGKKYTAMLARMILADGQWAVEKKLEEIASPPLPKASYLFPAARSPKFFDLFRCKVGPLNLSTLMKLAWFAGMVSAPAVAAKNNLGYVINDDADARKILVLVEKKNSGHDFMAIGFFKPPLKSKSIFAIAQAETYNNYFTYADSHPLRAIKQIFQAISWIDENLLPVINYSSLGANYQGRLMPVETTVVNKILNSKIFNNSKVGDDMIDALTSAFGTLENIKDGAILH